MTGALPSSSEPSPKTRASQCIALDPRMPISRGFDNEAPRTTRRQPSRCVARVVAGFSRAGLHPSRDRLGRARTKRASPRARHRRLCDGNYARKRPCGGPCQHSAGRRAATLPDRARARTRRPAGPTRPGRIGSCPPDRSSRGSPRRCAPAAAMPDQAPSTAVSGWMSMRHPVSRAASRAFWPSRPMARLS